MQSHTKTKKGDEMSKCPECGHEIGLKKVSVTIESRMGESCVYSSDTNYFLGPQKKCAISDRKCGGFLKKGCPFLVIQNVATTQCPILAGLHDAQYI